MQLGLKIWKWYNKMNHCFHSKSPIWASRLLQPCKKTAPHKKQTNIDCSLVILAILLLILPNNCTFFWIFAYCDCWLILQSGLIISFSRTFARLMSTKRDFIKGVLCVDCGSIDHSGFPFEKNWLERRRSIDCLTLPNQTLSALCKHGFRLFHVYVL